MSGTAQSQTADLALHLAEYQSIRAEILARQKSRSDTLRFGVTAIVAIWAFLATRTVDAQFVALYVGAWFLPCLIAFAGYVLNYNEGQGVKQAGAYLALLQARYGCRDVGGWEATLFKIRNGMDAADAPKDAAAALFPDGTPYWEIKRRIAERQTPATYSTFVRSIWLIIGVMAFLVALLAGAVVLGAHYGAGEIAHVWVPRGAPQVHQGGLI